MNPQPTQPAVAGTPTHTVEHWQWILGFHVISWDGFRDLEWEQEITKEDFLKRIVFSTQDMNAPAWLIPRMKGELTATLRRVTELEGKLARLPADWTQDSSLETWFPYTAQELPALRSIFPRILAALKSGACSPNCSIEFLAKIPDEVSAVVSSLTAERDEARRERDELREMLAVKDEALRKYGHHGDQCAMDMAYHSHTNCTCGFRAALSAGPQQPPVSRETRVATGLGEQACATGASEPPATST